MEQIERISYEVLDELKSSIASGHLKNKYSAVQIVEHELFFWETNIKCWCSDSEHYLTLWIDFLEKCGCGRVSSSYMSKILSLVSNKLKIKRVATGFRRIK